MLFIASEVKYRVTDHNIGKGIREGNLFNGGNLKILCGQSGSQRSGKSSYVLHTIAVQVNCKYLATFTQ